jgi:carboxymethylenebutenolidase
MCDQDHAQDIEKFEKLGLVTRRQLGGLVAAGACMALPAVANAAAVTESEVTIKTPDGEADAYFVHPTSGAAPGVLYWPDIFGLRPAARQMGKRLAESATRCWWSTHSIASRRLRPPRRPAPRRSTR